MKKFLSCIALAMVLVLNQTAASAVYANEETQAVSTALHHDEEKQRIFIRQKIREYFPDTFDTMLAIAHCESTGLIHWYPDGTLRPNEAGKSSAAGVFQVLLKRHGPDINRMGLDMHNIDDYMTFVRWLHDRTRDPFSDWNASRRCWQARLAQN